MRKSYGTGDSVVRALDGASLLGCGLASRQTRPENRLGKVVVLTGFAWFAAQMVEATAAWLNTIGLAPQSVWIIGLVWLLLSFPSGRLPGRLDRWLMAATAALALGVQLLAMLYGKQGRPALPRLCEQPAPGGPRQPH